MTVQPLLRVRDLSVIFTAERRTLLAVDRLGFDLARGEALAIVGESGSGKSVSALSLMRLLPPKGVIVTGRAMFGDIDLLAPKLARGRSLRGGRISMIYQDAMTALNPTLTIGRQFVLVLRAQGERDRTVALARTVQMLERVGIAHPRERLRSYPHQFSGGQLQRIMIALALICEPELLIADEPTTALDVTVQAQIVELIMRLQAEMNMAVIWITHDLSVIARLVDRVAVMYAGRIVEQGPVAEVLLRPAHHYTQGLIESLPRIDRPVQQLHPIPGALPNVTASEARCQFAERCPAASGACRKELPPVRAVQPGHTVACVHPISELSARAGIEIREVS